GAFHLREQRQEQERDAAHALVGGVDRQRVGEGTYADAPLGQVVNKVQDFAQVPPQSVQCVYDNRVAAAGVLQQRRESFAFDGGTGLLVDVDPLVGNAVLGQGVELA